MTDSLNIVFAGTPDFAERSLAALLDAGYRPSLVLTQPDRPAGRGQGLRPGPVKASALGAGIEVFQPASLRSPQAQARIAQEQPDFLIVAAYGLILPQAVLDIPRIAPLNVHASLLPRWRGAAPIQQAILAGDAVTGISLMRMEAGLDTGPVYATAATPIAANETAGTLHDRLAKLGGRLLVASLPAIASGAMTATAQPEDGVTYASKVDKADASIDWAAPAVTIERQVRAYAGWPVAFTHLDGKALRVHAARVASAPPAGAPGEIVAAGADGVVVATGGGALVLESVQLAGKRRIDAADFANQRPLVGATLGH